MASSNCASRCRRSRIGCIIVVVPAFLGAVVASSNCASRCRRSRIGCIIVVVPAVVV